jgi:hypothetical protein
MANWNLGDVNDKGMPGGYFWYLPTETEDHLNVTMPVDQVCSWLLDLLGIPLDRVRDLSLENTNAETLIRNIYNWKNGKVPRFETIKKSFPDNADIEFKGCLSINKNLSKKEQLQEVINFTKEKRLTPELLVHEIPIRDITSLEQIIIGKGEEKHNQKFVQLMTARYAQPTFKTIRQRLHVAKAMQDGYKRLLKFLCGDDVHPTCSNLNENKVLQLCHIYKFIYNLTIEAYRVNSNQAEEDKWFDSKLSEIDKNGLFLSVAPSRFSCSSSLLGELLTKRFQRTFPGEVLPNLFDPNPESKLDVFKQKLDEQKNWAEETITQIELEKLVRKGSPWRALQKEDRYWVITQVAQNNSFSFRIKEAAIQRLHEISKSSFEKAGVVLLETSFLLDLPKNKRPSDTQEKVTSLLIDIEQHSGFEVWKAPLLCAKAKHYVAINDFKSAVQYFKKGLAACDEQSYGPLRGFIAKDAFSTILQIEKLNSNNHEKYMREMLANGAFEYVDPRKTVELESLAKDLNCYFWDELYKPYIGIKKLEPSTETL